jgi:hypothetical protein
MKMFTQKRRHVKNAVPNISLRKPLSMSSLDKWSSASQQYNMTMHWGDFFIFFWTPNEICTEAFWAVVWSSEIFVTSCCASLTFGAHCSLEAVKNGIYELEKFCVFLRCTVTLLQNIP